MLATLDQRHEDRDQPDGQQQRAAEADPALAADRGAGLWDEPRSAQEGSQAQRHIDQEASAPAQRENVGLDERPTDQLPAHRGQAERHSIEAHRARPVLALVRHRDRRQHLGHQDPGGDALRDPRDHQECRVGSQPAGERGQREQPQADRVEPPSAKEIAQPPGDDQQGGDREAVACHDPLE